MAVDHSRKAFALIDAHVRGGEFDGMAAFLTASGIIPTGLRAMELGVLDDLDTCRETMYEVVNIAHYLLKEMAQRAGRTVEDELNILGAEIEIDALNYKQEMGDTDGPQPTTA